MKKKILNLGKLLSLFVAASMFIACGDDNKDDSGKQSNADNGFYVLCEGSYGQNNSALDFFAFADSTVTKDYFNSVNGVGLGETANKMIKVNNKLYIAVNGSAVVMVVNVNDGKLVKAIAMQNDKGENRQPRHLAANGNDIYVSCYDGNVVRISAQTDEITGVVSTTGTYCEGLAVCNGKIYVANSGYGQGTTVSVIDAKTFTFTKTIDVHLNPTQLKTNGADVFVLSMGDWSGLPVLTQISGNTDDVVASKPMEISEFDVYQGTLYAFYNNSAGTIKFKKINSQTLAESDWMEKPAGMVTPYKINVSDGYVFVTDANDYVTSGAVYVFDLNGNRIYNFGTSVGPNTVAQKRSKTIA